MPKDSNARAVQLALWGLLQGLFVELHKKGTLDAAAFERAFQLADDIVGRHPDDRLVGTNVIASFRRNEKLLRDNPSPAPDPSPEM